MNRATRIIVETLGIIFAISGIMHGYFETLQGSTPTNGVVIEAIHQSMQRWPNGELAFTLIPNFLITGIVAILVSLAIIAWSIGFLHTKHGATVFLLLFILLFLTGGGIAQIVFFTVAWAFATRINKPLTWWRRVLPESLQRPLASLWPFTLLAASLLFLLMLFLSVYGYIPGVNDRDQLLNIIFACLGGGLLLIVFSFIAGFAYDIRQQTGSQLSPAMSR
jgi:hypothetical protein